MAPVALDAILPLPLQLINLVLVTIVIVLFVKLFLRDAHKHIYTTPWKLLFLAVLVFVIEQVATVFRHLKLVSFNHLLINSFFEVVIVILFTYMLLLQKEHVKVSGF